MSFNIDKLIEKAQKGIKLDPLNIKYLCQKLKLIYTQEPNIIQLQSPISCVGDIHGQFSDLQEIFCIGGTLPLTKYLFLGDYVDRGNKSLEVMTLLFLYKLKYKDQITLLRGNHENKATTQNYGFYYECLQKYGDSQVWCYFTDLFDFMPISAVIDNNIFCVHGGISPSLQELSQIAELDRFREIPNEGPFADLMWSDPDPNEDNKGFILSVRGSGYQFGKDMLEQFLHHNGMDHLMRAHQICQEGYVSMFDDKLWTVWSAPNYCGRFNNLASILEINGYNQRKFNIFEHNDENLSDTDENFYKSKLDDNEIQNKQDIYFQELKQKQQQKQQINQQNLENNKLLQYFL